MRFVLGSDDFRQIRQDRAERDAEIDRINTRNRALRDDQRGSTAPVVPTGRKEELIFNQVGLTAAEQEAAAQQEALQRQKFLELGAFGPVDDSGDRPGTDRGPTPSYAGLAPSRVGKMGAKDVTQIRKDVPRPVQIIQGIGASVDVAKAIIQARDAVAMGKFKGIPATSPIAQLWSWGTDPVDSPIHAQRDAAIKMGNWVKSEAFANVLRNDPRRITEFNAGPIAFYKKYSQQTAALAAPPPPPAAPAAPYGGPAAPTVPGVATTTAPAAPVPSAANHTMKHDAITYLESTNGTNIPKWTKKQTSSGVYGATDGTATGHGIQGVYVAKLKGLTPGSSEFNAEKDKAAAEIFDHYLGLYPNDPARVAVSYRFGTTAGKNWNGFDAGIRALAKRVKGAKPVDPDEAVRYVQTYVQRQSGGAAPVTVASGAAPAGAAVPVTRTIIANNKNNPIEAKDQPIPTKGASMAKQLAIKKDPKKIKDLPFSMPFNFRAAELNTLLATRDHLRRTAFITGGSPASAAYIQARADLTMNKDAIEHTSKMQALFLMQNNNDPRMWNELAAREFPGRNVRISPNSDGTFRVEADGKIIGARVNKVKLIRGLRTSYSQAFHKRLEDAKVAEITKRDANMAKAQILILGETLKGMNEVRKQQLIGLGKLFTDNEGNTIGLDENGNRVLLEISESKGLGEDSEPITTIRERRVTKTDPKGLTTTATAPGVNPLLTSFFGSFK